MKPLEIVQPPAGAPSPAVRATHLRAQAKAAAYEQTRAVDDALRGTIALAREIAEGGDAYPAGIRDLCGRMAAEAEQRRQLLEVLAARGMADAATMRFGLDGR
ncbi:MAG TPA: hypothetical protein VL460_04710 [Caulobacteraceae bacterium]|jgi:hypothetical protein|nr:hypothetical protein [Caulobacteraceae bacterium]